MAIAIGAGLLYHRIKNKLKIKNEAAKILATFFLIEIVAASLIGFSTSLAERFQAPVPEIPSKTSVEGPIQKYEVTATQGEGSSPTPVEEIMEKYGATFTPAPTPPNRF